MPMPKVEIFCGGVQVTIERTKFVQMKMLVVSPKMSSVMSLVCHQSNLLTDKKKSAK